MKKIHHSWKSNTQGQTYRAGLLQGLCIVLALVALTAAKPLNDYYLQTDFNAASYAITNSGGLVHTNAGAASRTLTNLNMATGHLDWARVNKTGSSLADLITRSASDLTWASQTSNTVFAATDGTNGVPSFRKIRVGDVNTNNLSPSALQNDRFVTINTNGGTGNVRLYVSDISNVTLRPEGTQAAINLDLQAKGTGTMALGNISGPAVLFGNNTLVTGSDTLLLYGGNGTYIGTDNDFANYDIYFGNESLGYSFRWISSSGQLYGAGISILDSWILAGCSVQGFAIEPYGFRANDSIPGGNTVANTASETDFTSTYTWSGGAQAGDVVEITMRGTYRTDAVLAPTITGKLYLGGTQVLTTGALTTVVGDGTQRGWVMRATILVLSTTSVDAQGDCTFATPTLGTALTVLPANTAAVTVPDLSSNRILKASVQWSAADADNTITLRQFLIEHKR